MKVAHWLSLISLITLSGCDAILFVLNPQATTVELVNNGDFPVEVTLFIDDDQDIPEDVLTNLGTELQFVVPAGRSVVFSRDCDSLQALIVEDADLLIVGEIGPEASTDVLRDGSDFDCNDILTLTFDHSAVILDFDVTYSRERR